MNNFLKRYRSWIVVLVVIAVAVASFSVYQVLMLKKAHSTFENYYALRGCDKLISRTDTEGVCQLKNGDTIKIVKFDNRWFLDGDLPCGFLCF